MSHLLQPGQKTFVQRLDSQPDDRKAWLNSIAQSVVGHSLDVLRDADEHVLYDRFTPIIRDLDNLTHLAKADVDTAKRRCLVWKSVRLLMASAKTLSGFRYR